MNLPAGAQVWVDAGLDAAWTPEAHLTASAVDALHDGNWQRGGGGVGKPTPIPRPGDETRKQARRQQMHDKAQRFRQRHDREVP